MTRLRHDASNSSFQIRPRTDSTLGCHGRRRPPNGLACLLVWFLGMVAVWNNSNSASETGPFLFVFGWTILQPTLRRHSFAEKTTRRGVPLERRRHQRTTRGLSSSSSSTTTPSTTTNSADDDFDDFPTMMNSQSLFSKEEATTTPRTRATGPSKDDPEWRFFDTARIHVQGGDGGTGCVAFRREKGEARGGPNGGRGGAGGSIYLVSDPTMNTLQGLRQIVHHRAPSGKNGTGKNRDGSGANDMYVSVPIGTIVRDLATQQRAGDLQSPGDTLLVAKGGRGGRGNAAFMTARRTAPKLAERGEPGTGRWLSVELQLVADVGFLGKPNAGKSTLLAAASAARPKIADYPFTTIVPNLGVCDLGDGAGLVLCDIPGLIAGAASGAGMGGAFLRHIQRCRVLLHVVDGSSEDPLGDFRTINRELQLYDEFLASKPQVVVLNKIDIPEVAEQQEAILSQLRAEAGHSRVLSISAATTERVKELMGRLRKFVSAQPEPELPPPPEIDLSKAGLDYDSDDFNIQSDPAYPGQWRVTGNYIEQVARMTHWEYPEAVERFGRQLQALGIASALSQRGAAEGDLVMVDEFDFDFSPSMTNLYIPSDLFDKDDFFNQQRKAEADKNVKEERPWRPFQEGGFLDVDTEELVGFGDADDWDLLEDTDYDENGEFLFDEDEVWTA